jgi:hypothetical protein
LSRAWEVWCWSWIKGNNTLLWREGRNKRRKTAVQELSREVKSELERGKKEGDGTCKSRNILPSVLSSCCKSAAPSLNMHLYTQQSQLAHLETWHKFHRIPRLTLLVLLRPWPPNKPPPCLLRSGPPISSAEPTNVQDKTPYGASERAPDPFEDSVCSSCRPIGRVAQPLSTPPGQVFLWLSFLAPSSSRPSRCFWCVRYAESSTMASGIGPRKRISVF